MPFAQIFGQENLLKDVEYVHQILTQSYNADTLQKNIEETHTKFLKIHSAGYTIKVFEEAVASLSTSQYGKAISIAYFYISESYHKQLEKDKETIQNIENKYLAYINKVETPCLKAYLYSFLGYLYANENVKKYPRAKSYFEKTLQESAQNQCNNQFTKLHFLEMGAYIYERMGDYPTSLFYKIKTVEMADSLQVPILKRAKYMDLLARLHYRSENYQKALDIWSKVLTIYKQNPPSNKRDQIQVYNNLGLVKRAIKQFNEAEKYFQKSIQEAVNQKDSIWIAIAKGNIGILYIKQQHYEKAIPYLEEDIEQCIKSLELGNASISLGYLGDTYFALKQPEKAQLYYDSSLNLIRNRRYWTIRSQPQMEMEIKERAYKGLAEIYENQQNKSQAYVYLKLYLQVRDSLLQIRIKNNVAFLQAQYEFDKVQKQKETQIKEQRLWIAIEALSIIGFIVFTLVIYRLYSLQSIKKKLELENILLSQKAEKERNARLQEELALADRNLTIKALQLHEKNEALIGIRHELEKEDKLDKKVDKIIDHTINLEEDWEDFKKHFEEVHPLFFKYLQTNHHKLSQNDLKHCAYIRLGLDNKQIAHLMNVGTDSLKVSRTRLRKKLDLPMETDLFKFLSDIQ
ncbi:MAG: tetratricopeptide repeat protein [Raineya sp.]|jgi:tetratricopeptide (TPR) repeat protein|nr:tetratricopeptide repeat protein [Raineya sp.]